MTPVYCSQLKTKHRCSSCPDFPGWFMNVYDRASVRMISMKEGRLYCTCTGAM